VSEIKRTEKGLKNPGKPRKKLENNWEKNWKKSIAISKKRFRALFRGQV